MPEYLSPDDVVAMIPGMTKQNLAQLRFTGKGPRFYKPSSKVVLYERAEVIAWVEGSARWSTSEDNETQE